MPSSASGPMSIARWSGARSSSTRSFSSSAAAAGPCTPKLEESDADLARHQKWLAAIRARDYFDAPGGEEAAEAVASCEEALARFESEAFSAELDESATDAGPSLRVVDGADG